MESRHLVSELLDDPDPVLPHVDEALQHLSGVLASEEPLVKEVIVGVSQCGLSQRVDAALRQQLEDSVDSVRDKTRLNSLSLRHAGDWLNIVPCAALGLQLRPAEFRTATLYRLGMPIFQTEGPCVACGMISDVYADHAVSCASQGERISRHNHLRDALYHTAVSASLGPTGEDRALLPGLEARPVDIYISLWGV